MAQDEHLHVPRRTTPQPEHRQGERISRQAYSRDQTMTIQPARRQPRCPTNPQATARIYVLWGALAGSGG